MGMTSQMRHWVLSLVKVAYVAEAGVGWGGGDYPRNKIPNVQHFCKNCQPLGSSAVRDLDSQFFGRRDSPAAPEKTIITAPTFILV